MFQWASDKFDKLSQTVAPPPTDAAGRFSYAITRLDENTAMGCVAEIDPVRTVVNHSKGWIPIHMACQYSMVRLIRLLMNQSGASIQQADYGGLTPLHHACMSTQRSTGLEVVKILINEYSADPCAKNSKGQTPYDVATIDSIRQYLLPIQLQRETQYALDNGGMGLPPGIDLGGLKINRANMAPPPQFGGAGVVAAPPPGRSRYPQTPGMPPAFGSPIATTAGAAPSANAMPPAQHHPIPSAQPIARAPASMPARSNISTRSQSTGATSRHARSGGSSLAVYSKYKADGFHSSSSDISLQQKYGHVGANTGSAMPPPPSSGNAPVSGGASAPSGPNPFSGGGNVGRGSRYSAYGSTTAPAPTSGPMYSGMGYVNPAAGIATQTAPNYFTPGVTNAAPTTPAPSSSGSGLTSPFMPPPPYSGSRTAETQPAAASPAVTAASPAVHSPFVATQSNAVTPAVSNLFESPPKTSVTTETEPEIKEKQAPASTNLGEADSSKDTSSDWVETIDPTSGNTYYFNSKTNETSWDNPNTSTAVEESTTTPSTVAEQDADNENDWSETVDPSSGKSYYYNSKTGETSWEKPSSTTVDEANASNTTADNETIQDTHWVEATDPSSGNTYYYNSATDETSWERPSALDPKEELSNPNTSTSTENAESVPATAVGVVHDDTLAGQKEEKAEDESSPDANFQKEPIKEETHSSVIVEEKEESTAIAKAAKAEDETPTEIASPQASSTMETETTTELEPDESSSDALPEGWIVTTDPSSGKVYYYNMNTQETSWERPLPVNNTAGEGDKKPVALSKENVEPEVTEEPSSVAAVVDDLADGWEEVQDPTTGDVYYFNKETQETSWEKQASTRSESAALNDDATPNQQENDWVETLDPSSGKNYYYNSKTGETSWEKPTTLEAQEESPVTTASENQPMVTSTAESTPTSAEDKVAQPAVDTTFKSEETSEVKPQSSPLAIGHQRTLSAQEMFASPPEKCQSNGTPGPSTKFDRPDFISPAAATQGSVMSPGELSTKTAEDLFGANATDPAPAKMPESRTAEDLFGANNAEAVSAIVSESTDANANIDTFSSQNAEDSNEIDDGDMTDIPLSPHPVSSIQPSEENLPSIPNKTAVTPAPAPREDIFAAIGMPPPPFQSKR